MAGDTAEGIDESDTMTSWLPAVLAFVLGLSILLLTIAFRSLVVAAKAIAANLLSVGAAYGLLVLVFQEGFGNELFGFPQVDTIEAWVPLFLFAVLFGLSMDYHVLLDATLVRLVLLPAAMELLGDRNWYLPSWLSWLPDVRVEGPRSSPPARAPRTSGSSSS